MSDLVLQFTGLPLFFQTGMEQEVERSRGFAYVGTPLDITRFTPIPSGPLIIEAMAMPAAIAGGTIEIMESALAEDIGYWHLSLTQPLAYNSIQEMTIRTLVVPPGVSFRQFLNLRGPYAAINYTGAEWLRITPSGLVPHGPATQQLGDVVSLAGV